MGHWPSVERNVNFSQAGEKEGYLKDTNIKRTKATR